MVVGRTELGLEGARGGRRGVHRHELAAVAAATAATALGRGRHALAYREELLEAAHGLGVHLGLPARVALGVHLLEGVCDRSSAPSGGRKAVRKNKPSGTVEPQRKAEKVHAGAHSPAQSAPQIIWPPCIGTVTWCST